VIPYPRPRLRRPRLRMSAIGGLLTLVGLAALALSLSGVSAPQWPMTRGLPIPAVQNMPDRVPILQPDRCFALRIVPLGADVGQRVSNSPQQGVMGRDGAVRVPLTCGGRSHWAPRWICCP